MLRDPLRRLRHQSDEPRHKAGMFYVRLYWRVRWLVFPRRYSFLSADPFR